MKVVYLFLLFIALSACSSKSQMLKEKISNYDIGHIATKNITLNDQRKIVHLDEKIDVTNWSGNKYSELNPVLGDKITNLIDSKLSHYSENNSLKMTVNIVDAKKGFYSKFFSGLEYANVNLDFIIENLSSGKKKQFNSICSSRKAPALSYSGKRIDNVFEELLVCAIEKGLLGLAGVIPSEAAEPVEVPDNSSYILTENLKFQSKEFYSGEDGAILHDGWSAHSNWKIRLFYLQSLDAVKVTETSLRKTSKLSYGTGSEINPNINEFLIRPGERQLLINAEAFTAAPILSIFSGASHIESSLKVNFEKNKHYYINGSSDGNYLKVWIEDENGNIVSE